MVDAQAFITLNMTVSRTSEGKLSGILPAHASRPHRMPLGRRSKLEDEIAGLSEDKKAARRHDLQKREAEFLRLRRTRLSPYDFETLKVIGRGAFGEV